MDKEQVEGLFMRGQDCSQVVISHYADDIGLSAEEANRLASAFGGGSGMGETCGAVIGAMMVIGMKYGHNGPDDMDHRDALMAKRAEFINKWRERRGSCMCKDLVGDDISTPEGLGRILEAGTMFTLCPELVLDAIDVLDQIIKVSETISSENPDKSK
ncbi:MAG: C_GCAxxG_C_C family protein [Mogibacterium sp.]|nr:C_GCAxxG_C_C family protein [Mogibacterium sp.]